MSLPRKCITLMLFNQHLLYFRVPLIKGYVNGFISVNESILDIIPAAPSPNHRIVAISAQYLKIANDHWASHQWPTYHNSSFTLPFFFITQCVLVLADHHGLFVGQHSIWCCVRRCAWSIKVWYYPARSPMAFSFIMQCMLVLANQHGLFVWQHNIWWLVRRYPRPIKVW